MATNQSEEDPKENELPSNEHSEGLSAEDAASNPYNELDAWKKSKNTLYSVLGLIALGVAAVTFFNSQKQDEAAERTLRFMNASDAGNEATDQFLSFAEDYDDALGGVAQYRAAALQYADRKFAESAENFASAAKRLQGDPLCGRSLLGQAVSLIKDGKEEEGKSILAKISSNVELLPTDRFEASFLLGVQAMTDEDTEGFKAHKKILGADVRAASYLSRLEELTRTRDLLAQAKSLADINLQKGADFLSANRKRKKITETESGLQYLTIKAGKGKSPKEDDEVEVHYHGTLINGEVFDSSVEREETAKFRVNQVIKGWTEGLQLMKVGGKIKFFIPSDLAYGEAGNSAIGPNEVLVFEVELISITPKEEPDAIAVPEEVAPPAPEESNSSAD